MLRTKEKLLYRAFGFTVNSELLLPELIPLRQSDTEGDIEVVLGEVHVDAAQAADSPGRFFVKHGQSITLHIPDIGAFSMEDGRRITVSPARRSDPGEIRLLVLGTCMGTVLMQRKMFPLHGSAVAIGGKAYAFVGESGAGKSTLASAFLQEGYLLLSDDVIAVSVTEPDAEPYVIPSYPQQKLWQDSLDRLGLGTGGYASIYRRATKYCVPVSGSYGEEPLPLGGVIELVKHDEAEIRIAPIGKLDRFQTLFEHTYRNILIAPLQLNDWHFNVSATIARTGRMYRLHRPSSRFTAPQLVSTILESIQ